MSLYRKHRPQQFADVVGQEHIKTTLANALRNGTFSHAYIFAGPKGTGKTTTARLLAKALNCTGRDLTKDFEPCGKCTSCIEITAGNSMDVLEIDAASNRGIDEIRDLREKIKFAPTAGRYKVYVIDECHMLTKEAFNALLKTLEEPPRHAVFILATTELHKVPATILSRAQLFDFKKAKFEEGLSLLKDVVKKEKIKIEDEALALLARLAYGAYRDALTLLDQVAAISPAEGGKITLSQVQSVLGQATEQSVWDLVGALASKDRSKALQIVNEVYFEGKDLGYFVGEVVNLLRKIVLTQAGLENQFETSKEEKAKISEYGAKLTSSEVIHMIQKMVDILPQVKVSVLAQLPLEMAIFELTEGQLESLKSKVESPKAEEEKETIGKVMPKSAPVTQKSPLLSKEGVGEVKSAEEKDEPEEITDEIIEIDIAAQKSDNPKPTTDNVSSGAWPAVIKIMKAHNNMIAAMLRDAVIKTEDDEQIVLGFKNKFNADQVGNNKIRPLVEAAILEVYGRNLRLECIIDGDIKMTKPVEPEEELLDAAKSLFESD